MSHTTFIDGVTLTSADWFNDVDSVTYTLFGNGTSYTGALTLGSSGNIAVNTNKFTVAASSGNTAIGGTLAVTGATTLSAALTYGGVTLSNSVSGTGSMLLSTSPTITTPTFSGHITVEGVTTTGATGTGNLVFSGSPVLTTPNLGTPSAVTLTNATGLPISSGVSGLGTGVATALAVNTGSAGAVVLFNGALGTPTSGTLTNATGLPVSTGVSGLGTGVATFLATPSSANLLAAVTDETGSGALVFGTSPTISGATLSGTTTAGAINSTGAITAIAAATQDAMRIQGRAGGTSSYIATLTPTTLTASRTLTLPDVTDTLAVLGTAQTFTAAQTFRAANSVRVEAASTQDAIVLAGRAGGTSSYAATLTPTTLTASRTLTLPDTTDTLAVLGTAQTFSAAQTFSSTVTMSGTTTNIALGTSQTTGTWTAGGTAQTGTMTLGNSADTQTVNIATGAAATGKTKAINIGTGGLSGSTTTLVYGGSASSTTHRWYGTTVSMYLDAAGNLDIPGVVTMSGATPYINVGSSAVTTGSTRIEIGTGRTGDGASYVDLVGDTTYTDFGLRMIRTSGGANTNSQIAHRGTGSLYVTTSDAGSLILQTSSSDRLSISPTGTVTLSGALAYGGVTLSNSVTGTGSMVLSANPTLTGTLTAAAISASGDVTRSSSNSGAGNYLKAVNTSNTANSGAFLTLQTGGTSAGTAAIEYYNGTTARYAGFNGAFGTYFVGPNASGATPYLSVTSTGLAVTGALSAAGAGMIGGTTARTNTQFSVWGANAKATASSQDVASFTSSDATGTEMALVVSLTGSATATSRLASIQSVEQGTGYRELRLNPSGGNVSVGGNTPTAGILQAVGTSGGISLALSDNVHNSLYVKHSAGNVVLGTDSGGGMTLGTNGFTPAISIDSAQAVVTAGTLTVGAAGGNVSWGTYTPTMTAVANVSTAAASGAWQYMRVGNTITVSGQLTITGGASGAQVRATLPVASALTNDYQLAGAGAVYETSKAVSIIADTVNDAAYLFQQSASGAETWTVTFTYRVL